MNYMYNVSDPCIDGNTFVLQSKERRTPNCPYLNDNLCDAYISDGWYKSQEPMLKTCTRLNTCGTVFPVWMNGTDPTSQEGVVTRNACLSGPTNCCQKTYQIKVKSCDTFKAYCLPHFR
ncbi:hypothetical protein KUTeg_011953 [Tegillarca granosa]|uniref:UMOD/GP2/OIT3-like D8C domain-containing protein n=1 Tax=Tegillarca granosa TaxID=220873 RepID=A0ABQ9EY54_TEGGR|nr:hypothetical protein KUTeg_011953 [Tegillarca granosa]